MATDNFKPIEIDKIDREILELKQQDGKITITTVAEPYGPGSESVASVGISLQAGAQEPDWKVHIPKANIDAVIAALQEAKKG